VIDFAYGFMEHSGEHYGQLVVYLPRGGDGTARIAAEK